MVYVIFALLIIVVLVAIKCFSYWVGLLLLSRWLEINGVPQPSDDTRREIIKWVASNILKDLKKI